MITLASLSEERINLVNEYNTRLDFPRKAKQPGDELVRLAVPLVGKRRDGDIDKGSTAFFSERTREHRLPAPGWAV